MGNGIMSVKIVFIILSTIFRLGNITFVCHRLLFAIDENERKKSEL